MFHWHPASRDVDNLGKSVVNRTDRLAADVAHLSGEIEAMRPWAIIGPVVAALGIVFALAVFLGWLVR